MVKPLNTKRYCLVCMDIKTFSYIKNIGHSGCKDCGGRFAIHPNNYEIIRKHLSSQESKKIKELRTQIQNLKNKIQRQKDHINRMS